MGRIRFQMLENEHLSEASFQVRTWLLEQRQCDEIFISAPQDHFAASCPSRRSLSHRRMHIRDSL